MKFKPFVSAILAILGVTEWQKNESGAATLTEDDVKQLKGYGFSDAFITDFKASLERDFAEEDAPGSNSDDTRSTAALRGLVAQYSQYLAEAQAQLEAMRETTSANANALALKDKEIEKMKQTIALLSNAEEKDPGLGAQRPAQGSRLNYEDDSQLGGMQGEMFALADRPYNQRARAAMLLREGKQVTIKTESSMDYAKLREDLGAFYRIPWQERLQSLLMQLPSVESIFPLESGYQDLAVLANVWLGEFSQAGNESSDFDKVVKGKYQFDDEVLRMYDVMFAHKFKSLKEIEKLWIGYLNKEGSNVMKWSFIEYILAETAKKLFNERELRRINGVRKNPDLNVPGRAMEAADGLFEFINKKVNGWKNTSGTTVYQIKPFELGQLTEANIGEKIFEGTSMIPAVYRDSGMMALYMSSALVVKYHKYNELHYGQNTDYKANQMYVKEYPSVKIIPIPNADNHERIIWTFEGNIKTFELLPGEMLNFQIEQQDWTLKVWSSWKESIWAQTVGKQETKQADLKLENQAIFCNEYDLPATYFIEAPKDANPSAARHTSIVTVANTSEFTITDITDAKVGQVITLKCGSVDKGVKIEKSGNFDLISAAWTPAVGDTIKLMKRSDGHFIELGRTTAATEALEFAADATTPSLAGGTVFVTNANTTTTAITNFTDATVGTVYTIYGAGSTNASTIANSGNFVLTAAMTLSDGAWIQLTLADDKKFYEVARNK